MIIFAFFLGAAAAMVIAFSQYSAFFRLVPVARGALIRPMTKNGLETVIVGELPFDRRSDAEILDAIAKEIAGIKAAKNVIDEVAASMSMAEVLPLQDGKERRHSSATDQAV